MGQQPVTASRGCLHCYHRYAIGKFFRNFYHAKPNRSTFNSLFYVRFSSSSCKSSIRLEWNAALQHNSCIVRIPNLNEKSSRSGDCYEIPLGAERRVIGGESILGVTNEAILCCSELFSSRFCLVLMMRLLHNFLC